MIPSSVDAAIAGALHSAGPVLWLTGAGISAESGIPTFRGKDGYWTVGSTNYRPEDLATRAAFVAMREEVWSWYLYRRSVCRAASPNAAHRALVQLEQSIGDRFALVTQNVDGLHERAGQSLARTYAIHGNIDLMRAVDGRKLVPVPEGFDPWAKARQITADEMGRLVVDGSPARPHVLWFDETYDEEHFRFESTLALAARASILFIVGSQGTTNLPTMVARHCVQRGVPVFVIDPAKGRFTDMLPPDAHLQGSAAEWVPSIVERLV